MEGISQSLATVFIENSPLDSEMIDTPNSTPTKTSKISKTPEKPLANILMLPLTKIFSYLSPIELSVVQQVNKHFRDVARGNIIFLKILGKFLLFS